MTVHALLPCYRRLSRAAALSAFIPARSKSGLWLASAVTLLIVLLAATTARADDDRFVVTGITVALSGKPASEARSEAIQRAEQMAFDQMLAGLITPEERARIGTLDPAVITDLVSDLAVTSEKASASRYVGEFSVRFRPDVVRLWLSDYGIEVAATPAPPPTIMVLPVYQNGVSTVLWDHPNPWREAWVAMLNREGETTLILPDGGLDDLATISAEQAMAGDRAGLRDLASDYGAKEVIVAVASTQPDDRGGAEGLTITAIAHDGANSAQIVSERIAGDGSDLALLDRGVQSVAAAIRSGERDSADEERDLGGPAVLPVSVAIDGLRDWMVVQQRLRATSAIEDVDVVMLAQKEVRINLHYTGSIDRLNEALAFSQLALVQDASGWLLMPATTSSGTP